MNAMMMMNANMMMIPIGFRFNPSDEEVIEGYLWARIVGEEVPWNGVAEKQIYGALPPWEIFNDGDLFSSKIEGGAIKKSTYVFTTLTRASKMKISRRAGSGTWKGQIAATNISSSDTGEIIGHMRMLSFQPDANAATPPPESGHWTMHEYYLSEDMAEKSGNPKAADLVICKITKTIKINNNNMLPMLLPLPLEEKASSSESSPPSKKQKIALICGDDSSVTEESLPNCYFDDNIDVDGFWLQDFPDGAAAEEGSIINNNMLPPLLLPPTPPPHKEEQSASSSESAPPSKKQKTTLMCDEGTDEPLPNCYLDDKIDIDELWLQCCPAMAMEGSIIPVEASSAAMPNWDPDVIDIDNIFGHDYQLPIDIY